MRKFLSHHDGVDIVAPGSHCHDDAVQAGIKLLQGWHLTPHIDPNIFGPDLLYTNTNAERYRCLDQALDNPDSAAIWCLRGGSGSTRMIPYLEKKRPTNPKIFIGFSDITALHLYFYQNWGWYTCLHGPALKQVGLGKVDQTSIADVKGKLFSVDHQVRLSLQALNDHLYNHSSASTVEIVSAPLHGGNLSLIQSSLGTSWHINPNNHILIVEDVNEKPYRTAERLEQLRQANVFKYIKALIFGDFSFAGDDDTAQDNLNNAVLKQFAHEVDFPVFKTQGIGHTAVNRAFWLGSQAAVKYHNGQYYLHY